MSVKVGEIMAMRHLDDQSKEENLTISVVPELNQRIRRAAEEKGLSVQKYIEQVLEQVVPQKGTTSRRIRRGHLNRAAVDDLMQFQSYIKEKYADQVFEDSAELLNQIREERMRELENDR